MNEVKPFWQNGIKFGSGVIDCDISGDFSGFVKFIDNEDGTAEVLGRLKLNLNKAAANIVTLFTLPKGYDYDLGNTNFLYADENFPYQDFGVFNPDYIYDLFFYDEQTVQGRIGVNYPQIGPDYFPNCVVYINKRIKAVKK